jgi:protein phosphatase
MEPVSRPDRPTPTMPREPPPLVVRAFGLSDRGQVRSRNEDQYLIAEVGRALRVSASSLPQPRTLFAERRAQLLVVADGMGGHSGGQEASALAVATLEQFLLDAFQFVVRLNGESVLSEFQEALRAADARIFDEARNRPELTGMGTTLTVAYAAAAWLYVAHAGDSRLYLFRDGQLHQLTHDHTLVSQLVDRGVLNSDEARTHHLRHVITNAVGGTERGLEAEIHKMALEPGDLVLLCTDGLTEMLEDAELARTLARLPDPEAACRALVGAANEAGGRDNVTAIVARFDPAERDD